MNAPRVSVLMAVHNGEAHLRESIDSILQQSFTDFEFLIIDDASSDHSRDVILSYQDRRIRLVSNQTKLGLTCSLNRGLRLAVGDLIARQDADDVSERHRLARQREFLDANPRAALVGTWYKKIDDCNSDLGTRQLPCDWLEIRWALLFLCPFIHSSVMLRKNPVLKKIGAYDESFIYAQDYDLWSRIASRLPVANLPEYLVRYRVSPQSMTSTYGDIVRDEIRRTSITNLAGFIGTNQAESFVDTGTEFTDLSALLFGEYRYLSPERSIAASRRFRWLLDAFVRRFENDRRKSQFEAKLRFQVARRLVDLGDRRSDEAPRLVSQLTVEACRLHWPELFRWDFLRVVLKLMKRQFAEMRPILRG